MTAAVDAFVEDARAVTVAEAATRLGLRHLQRGAEHPQPCPVCGGKDRFSFNTAKNKWHCRGCDRGGGDGIGLAAHVLGFDINRRDGFLEACAATLGQPVPAGGERESDVDRQQREAQLAQRRRDAAEAERRRDLAAADFRARERQKARGIWEHAAPLASARCDAGRRYLDLRCGGFPDGRRGDGPADRRWLRVAENLTYWHGQDERGQPLDLHSGPAMVAPFLDADGQAIGCHITWIDLAQGPKFRPRLHAPDTGETLPTKKMRGSKKGGFLPLCGPLEARRWAGGEGIENGLAFAHWEGFRADTLYFAAGDLGNLAGPADPKARAIHPAEKAADKNGRARPVFVPGAVPKPGQAPDEAMPVPDHVTELVLLADGDSEAFRTALAMRRAKTRLFRAGRTTTVFWPPRGRDFSDLAGGAS